MMQFKLLSDSWSAIADPAVLLSQTRSGELRFQWMNLPESWGVFVWLLMVALLIFGVFTLYRRESSTCPPFLRLVLASLRTVVMLLLLVMLLMPSVFYQQVSVVKPTIMVLRDASLSMARRDTYRQEQDVERLANMAGIEKDRIRAGELSRADLVNAALKHSGREVMHHWRHKGSIGIVDFADGVEQVALIPALETQIASNQTDSLQGTTPESPQPFDFSDLDPTGLGTDIWQALRYSLDEGHRLSAIVLISEGQHNGSNDPLEIARRAQSMGIPIFTVGVGDPTPARNISVTNVYTNRQLYPGEPFEVEGVLQVTMSPSDPQRIQQVAVELLSQKVDGSGQLGTPQVLARQDVPIPDRGGRVRGNFRQTLSKPRKKDFSSQAPPIGGENDLDDNIRQSAEVQVIDEKIRVLLVSGFPNWDYQHLRKLLQQDASIQLSCWLQSLDETMMQEGNLPITRLPRTLDELGQYNVVIMIDPNPLEFDQNWMEVLKEYCRHKAGGVLYMAGPHFTSEFVTMSRLRGFLDILPVRFGDAASIAAFQVLAEASQNVSGGMQVLPNALNHPVMNFRGDLAENQRRWSEMPGFVWHFPTLAAKPAARVLIERGDQVGIEGNQPMLVEGRFGAGTILYVGFQGTWRWRSVGVQAQYFDRFWVQTIRFLTENRMLQGARRGFIDLDQSEFELGRQIVIRARLLDEQFRPSTLESIDVNLTDDTGRQDRLKLTLVPEQPGHYEGAMVAARSGNYQAIIALPDATPSDTRVEPISFRIVAPSVEANAYWLNEKLLREIADQSGGRYVQLDQLGELTDLLPRMETRVEFNSPPEPVWDLAPYIRWTMLLVPVLLLSLEWALRKWFKLL